MYFSVLYISLHRFDCGSYYPYGGEGYHKCVGGKKAQGYNVNIAWNDVSYSISLYHFDCGSYYPYGGEGYHKCVGGKKAQGYNVNIAWNDVNYFFFIDLIVNFTTGLLENFCVKKVAST